MTRASHEAAKLKEFLLRKGNNLESLWGPLWFDAVLISAPPSEALGIAEAIRSEWIDTARLCVHAQCETEKSTPAADAIRVVMKNEKEIAKDYEDWQGGLVLSSSHETHLLRRMGRSFTGFHIALPSHDEVHFSDLPQCGLRGAGYLYEQLWNAKLRK